MRISNLITVFIAVVLMTLSVQADRVSIDLAGGYEKDYAKLTVVSNKNGMTSSRQIRQVRSIPVKDRLTASQISHNNMWKISSFTYVIHYTSQGARLARIYYAK